MKTGQTGKVMWITGASSGIGEALARWYNNRGWRLVLTARRKDALEDVVNGLEHPENTIILPMDVSEFERFPESVDTVLKHFGRIDCCILNAGISHRSFIRETRFEVFKKLVDVNYLGTVAHALAVLPKFRRAGGGHFVVISSMMGKFSSPGRAGYCGSKHALHGFFDGLRMEEYPNIKVTLVCPGFVSTSVSANALTGDGKPRGTVDRATEKGVPVDKAAEIIAHAVSKGKREIAFGGIEKTGLWLKRFFPSMLDKVVLSSKKNWEFDREEK
ncbi:MAG: SDR family oxidoreductase [Saprospirales bacterium]|nr:MAG: SDR family oxidoreductase [Saprospirales bacterium]